MSFVFVVCQAGAESALKSELSRRHPEMKLAFSRPGFVTFKAQSLSSRKSKFDLKSVFARTWGYSIGKVSGTNSDEIVSDLKQLLKDQLTTDRLKSVSHCHIWQRDKAVPGELGFEPGITPLAEELGHAVLPALQSFRNDEVDTWRINETAEQGEAVIDCVLVEPGEWWIGWHIATEGPRTWPGGVPQTELPEHAVSRTYLKMAETLEWSRLPIERGDVVVEIGSSPGGSCQALLDRGLSVTGVDPAEMDEALLKNPYFTHVRGRAKDLPRKSFSRFRWLASDASVAPNYTLDTIEAIVSHRSVNIEGLMLTLKLPKWELAENIPLYNKRIRSWGYRNVRARQLAFNRREICVVASNDG